MPVATSSTQSGRRELNSGRREPVNSDRDVAPGDQSDESEPDLNGRTERRKGHRAKKYINEDLPGFPKSLARFRDVFFPRWLVYVSTIDNIWDLQHDTHVGRAQAIWDHLMKIEHTVAIRGEPVYALVCYFFYVVFLPLTFFVTVEAKDI